MPLKQFLLKEVWNIATVNLKLDDKLGRLANPFGWAMGHSGCVFRFTQVFQISRFSQTVPNQILFQFGCVVAQGSVW